MEKPLRKPNVKTYCDIFQFLLLYKVFSWNYKNNNPISTVILTQIFYFIFKELWCRCVFKNQHLCILTLQKKHNVTTHLRSPCPSGSSWWSQCRSWTVAWRGGLEQRCTRPDPASSERKPRLPMNWSGFSGEATGTASDPGRWWGRPTSSSLWGCLPGCWLWGSWPGCAGSSCKCEQICFQLNMNLYGVYHCCLWTETRTPNGG